MDNVEHRVIEIPEICRVEGHSAVTVDIKEGNVTDVKLDVFEGTRFFERIVIGHKYDEIPHITSRVCAICSTGHILAAVAAIERIFNYEPSDKIKLYRELMHLGMIIESHSTHVCALALPDFLGTEDVLDLATKHPEEFNIWVKLRNLGTSIQTIVGGRPFHPVNLHVGGLSRYPADAELKSLHTQLIEVRSYAQKLCQLLESFKMPIGKTSEPCYLALVPNNGKYSFFGQHVRASDGWEAPIDDYKQYLAERAVTYSHAKRSELHGKPFMVGALARLHFYSDLLGKDALSIYKESPLASGNNNTLYNNLAQAIEIVEVIDQSIEIVNRLLADKTSGATEEGASGIPKMTVKAGRAAGAVECPRGTLYHYYELDEKGCITVADMITPSAQNTARIELDIRNVAQDNVNQEATQLQPLLETLIRAYDPCNTCATHAVQLRYM